MERDLPFQPTLCVAIAPIVDLEEGQRRRLSDYGNSIQIYMGGQLPSDDDNDRDDPYKLASPSRILPIMVPCILVGGDKDEDGMNVFMKLSLLLISLVPLDIVESFHVQCMMSYSNTSPNGDIVTPDLLVVKNADHYQVMYLIITHIKITS